MARDALAGEAPNFDAINLARALARLEPKIDGDAARLRCSSIERAKTTANLEYARTLLLRLEHSTSQLKAAPRKRAAQATLQEQRALLKKLTERLYELEHTESNENGVGEEGEDILLQLAPPPPPPLPPKPAAPPPPPKAAHQPNPSTEYASSPSSAHSPRSRAASRYAPPGASPPAAPASPASRYAPVGASPPAAAPATPASPQASPKQQQQQPQPTPPPPKVSSPTTAPPPPPPSSATQQSGLRARNTPRDALLGDAEKRAKTTGREDVSGKQSKELSSATTQQLESADAEQGQLTDSMLALAAALKKSAQAFASDLDADKATVGRTEDALDRNREGMDATSSRMAKLRKMSEGRWFATRVGMMILIPVLWVVLLLQVFVFPKLRF